MSPFTHCVIEEHLFNGFSGTMGLSDCPDAYTLGFRSQTFPSRTELRTCSVTSGLSRLPRMELLRMQRVSDSVGRCATRFSGPFQCCRSTFVFSVFRLVSRRCHNISTIHQSFPVNRYASCCLPRICTRSTHQRVDFGAQYLAYAAPRQRFAAPLRVADA